MSESRLRGRQAGHARRAARERYGLDARACREVECLVRAGPSPDCVAIETGHAANGYRTYAVSHGGRWLPVVYDPATRMLVSFLPEFVLRPCPPGGFVSCDP